MIRLLVAEDQAMIRGLLVALLSHEGDIEVVAELERGDLVVEEALRTRPDVALLDIEMPGQDGLAVAAELRERVPACRVLILTVFGRPGYLRRAVDSGVAGFLLKDAQDSNDQAGAFAVIVLILLVGVGVNQLVFAPLERRVLRTRGLA